MARLNIERQNALEPLRMEKAKQEITKRELEITHESDIELRFIFKDKEIKYFPYSGWASGSTIKDGRGLSKLLKQLDNNNLK